MTDAELLTAVCGVVQTITGAARVIEAYPAAAPPSLPYIEVNFLGSAPVRANQIEDEFAEVDGIETQTPVVDTEWRFSVHAFGQGSSDLLRRLVSGARLLQPQEAIEPLIIHEVSEVRSVPEYVNNAWQPRAQADLFIRGLTRDGFVIIPIDEASFTINGRASGPISP